MNKIKKLLVGIAILTFTCCNQPQHVPIYQHFWAPNTFSPDNDAINDRFYITPVWGYDIKEYHLTIYNQNFQEIFTSNDLNDQWDGKFKNENIPEGVYDYQIIFLSSQLLDSTSTDSIYTEYVTSSSVNLHRNQ